MDYDWCAFEEAFIQTKRSGALGKKEILSPVYIIQNQGIVFGAYADGEDLREWIGTPINDVMGPMEHRQVFVFDLEKVNASLSLLHEAPHYVEQVAILRDTIAPDSVQRKGTNVSGKKAKQVYHEVTHNKEFGHFLIDSVSGWWRKVLPNTYGIYIKIEGHEDRDLILITNKGHIQSFHTPDFSSMNQQQARQFEKRVDYLSKFYMLPIQGLVFKQEDWMRWSQKKDPWKSLLRAYFQKRWTMAPNSIGRRLLFFLRAIFKI